MVDVTPRAFPPLPCKGCRHLVYGRRDERGTALSEIECGWWKTAPFPVLGIVWPGNPRQPISTLQGRIDGPFTDGPTPECPRKEPA